MTLATTLLIALLTATNPSSDGGPSDPILLDFHADWCGPCRQMAPAVDQLSRKGYPVQKVDIDHSPGLANRYGVQAVPTFVVVDRSGRELDRTSGLQPAGAGTLLHRRPGQGRAPDQAEDQAVTREDSRADDRDADREDPPARPVRRTGRQPAPAPAPTATMTAMTPRMRPRSPSPIPTRSRRWCGSRCKGRTRRASARGRSSTARPSSRSS